VSSDAEKLARARVLIAFLVIYLLCVGFLALGERLYGGTSYVIYTRLATLPFLFLLVRRWVALVRVRPPAVLLEARQLLGLGKPAAAREKLAEIRAALPGTGREIARLERARRILQDGLAVTVDQECLLEMGRCSLLLGELDRAVSELGEVAAQLPRRAEIAMDLAEALARSGQEARAAETLRAALQHLDAVDQQMLIEQPSLHRLIGDAPLPRHSSLWGRVVGERLIALALLAGVVVHGLHFYLRLF